MFVKINYVIDIELKHTLGCCFCYMNVQLDKVYGSIGEIDSIAKDACLSHFRMLFIVHGLSVY